MSGMCNFAMLKLPGIWQLTGSGGAPQHLWRGQPGSELQARPGHAPCAHVTCFMTAWQANFQAGTCDRKFI